MIATTVQSFAIQIDELLSQLEIKHEPLIIERDGGNWVAIPQVEFDNLMASLHKKQKNREEYVQLRDTFFQSSRQSMASKLEKYLD
jgi:PHD/YefM family antitoxin component YafN of YafNO toxin-antitoxin module